MSEEHYLSNLSYIETLYQSYLSDPDSVDPSWQRFFEGMQFGEKLPTPTGGDNSAHLYRVYGHKMAHINPLSDQAPAEIDELKGLSNEKLKAVYCGKIGFEYMNLDRAGLEEFVQEQVEQGGFKLTKEERLRCLERLNKTEALESFLQMKYPGQKRFSVEGGEALIPMLWEVAETAAQAGVTHGVLGMAHRGRINVLVNVLGKSYEALFGEFESGHMPKEGEGRSDVKYHKGYSADLECGFHLALAANPSHLEAVDAVVLGKARAKQEQGLSVVPILIHGDASIAGQGIVYECLQLSALEGYTNGGTIHIVVNNQVGFTAMPHESRSSFYCTDIAKAFGAPVFHVNGDDPDGCIEACRLAVLIREKFKCDVFIDLNCYRKYGHNEGDEPSFTQPLIYETVRAKKNVRDLYAEKLMSEGLLDGPGFDTMQATFKAELESALQKTKEGVSEHEDPGPQQADLFTPVETAVPKERLIELAEKFCKVPDSVNIHPKVQKLFEQRLAAVKEGSGIDWGLAEYLAYATLLLDGHHVRLSGQDSTRGTFSHRHAAIVDQKTGEPYQPLNHLADDQASFSVYNSPLSEYGVMGFEFGYTLAYEKALVIWEAQYGDFANGAQVVIDQFVTSAEQKWGRLSSLVLQLPHGYEGQGPEHSSARIERFLQLAADDSVYICSLTHPAQVFHMLRRQKLLPFHKPLIYFSPKALLRYPPSLSSIDDFTQGGFQEVLDDPSAPTNPEKLYFCTGKVYYDLVENRKERSIAIVRIEQLYPFPEEKVKKILDKYASAGECVWVQEEHSNMGAASYISALLPPLLEGKMAFKVVSRDRSSSPSAGTNAMHKKEQERLLDES